jgi:peptide/nickel transport system substrate-binding protein
MTRCFVPVRLSARFVVALACVAPLTTSFAQERAYPLTLTLAMSVDNNTFDPAQLSGGARDQYWTAVYDTVLRLQPDGKIVGNLAESWEYNDELTALTLKLRDGLKFADGTPLDAAAIWANFENLKSGTGENSFMMAGVESADIPDPQTLVLKIAKFDPAFLGYLTTLGGAIANPANLEDPNIAVDPAESGPYVLNNNASVTGSRYEFDRNLEYWNAQAFPYDKLVLLPMPDLSARLNALRSGQVNAGLADPKSVAVAKESGLTVNTGTLDWVGFSLADRDGTVVPAMADVRVRQAINYAIDADGILQFVQKGMGVRSTQPFGPTNPAHDAKLDTAYPYDPEKARALMKEAGYADGFELRMPRSSNPFFDSADIVQQQLGEIGIRVVWDQVSPQDFYTVTKEPRWAAHIMQLASGDAWRDVQKLLPPGGPWNPFGTETPELTALIEKASMASGEEYEKIMREISTYVVENAWFAPWYFSETIYLTDAKTSATMQPWTVSPVIANFKPAN